MYLKEKILKIHIFLCKFHRDFGQFLRDSLKNPHKKFNAENQEYWDRQYLALQKLHNNEHFLKYPRQFSSSASGLTADQCNIALSNEFLEELEKEEKSLFRKIFSSKS